EFYAAAPIGAASDACPFAAVVISCLLLLRKSASSARTQRADRPALTEKREPASDIDTRVVDGLKVLDPGGRLERRTSAAASEGPTRMTCITELPRARLARSPKVHQPAVHHAATLFFIAPMIAVSMAPPAPPAIACEMMPPMLRLPDCAAAVIAGSNNVTIWPSTPPPIKPEMMLPIIPRSKVGDDLPTPTPPSAPVTRLIKICSMLISQPFD